MRTHSLPPVLALGLVTAAVATAAAGCGTFVSATALNRAPYDSTPRSASEVELHASAPPARAHVDVALLEVEQTDGLNEQGLRLMLRRLRQRAGEIGCDAVVVGGMTTRDGAPTGSGWRLVDPGSRTLLATCVVYTDDNPAPAPTMRDRRHIPRSSKETIAGNLDRHPTSPVRQEVDAEEP